MEKINKNGRRHKMKILESAYNEIINTIGSLPAESGGLLFGKEDDMVIQKFIFDEHAKITRSSYTFNTEFLNPEIKRIWNEEGLSCLGFIHSHPHGYGRLSVPDIEYFTSMFEYMPRKYYFTPIVFTVPDGGFKIHPLILPMNSKLPVRADLELLPDDFLNESYEAIDHNAPQVKQYFFNAKYFEKISLDYVIQIIWMLWKLALAIGFTWFLFKTLYIFTNYLNTIWS